MSEPQHHGHEIHPGPEAGGRAFTPHGEAHRDRHAGHDIDVLRQKFWVCLLLTIPVLLYSPGLYRLLGFVPPSFPGSTYIPFIFGTIIFFYGGTFFLKGAYEELRELQPGMMTLISLAISVAFLYSIAVQFFIPGEPLYWELSTLVTIMLLGHWIEMKAVGQARGALQELAKLMPDQTELVSNSRIKIVPVDQLRKDDIVLIRPGGKIPADGEVTEGETNVNESMITGESRPIDKSPGDPVIAGTLNGAGSIRVRVTKVGDETALAGIMRLVEEAQSSRSRTQVLADRIAYWLTVVAVFTGIITFTAWVFTPEPLSFALERAVSVLVIACPHALGLAIPLVIAISTTLGAKNGLLVRDRLALETARKIDVVLFDKTGTLTKGEFGVVGVYPSSGWDKDRILSLAAAVEADSEHDIARSIVRSAREQNLDLPVASGFRAFPGRGAVTEVEGTQVMVGGPRLLESLGIEPPRELRYSLERSRQSGHTVVYLVQDNQVIGAVALADMIREEAREAVRILQEEGVRVAMITGDSRDVAQWVAGELAIDEYYAEVLPQDKAQKVRELQHRGKCVAMVGDGVNDAPALAAADVGIAIGAGTDVAIEAGDIVLVKNDPRDVARVVLLSRASYTKMVQNLIWAAGYNIVAIPLAAGVLAGRGIILPPAAAAILMSASTVIVALNSQLLWGLRLSDDAMQKRRSTDRQRRPQRRQPNLRPAFPGHHGAG